jgi:hypothetical protein
MRILAPSQMLDERAVEVERYGELVARVAANAG